MGYNDIKSHFYNSYSHAKKSFKECSRSDDCSEDLVQNPTICLKYEKIVNNQSRAVDSLYFGDKKQSVFFIEFKNTYYYNYQNINVEKAVDSLIFYENECVKYDLEFKGIDSFFVAVYSKLKTLDRVTPKNALHAYITLLMINAKIFFTFDGKESYNSMFRRQFLDLAKTRGLNNEEYSYKDFVPLLSDDFDSYIDEIS